MVTDFRALIDLLVVAKVDFVVIGGVALVVRGAPRTTDHSVQVLTLAGLKRAKQAAGRLKDLADLAHIEEMEKRS